MSVFLLSASRARLPIGVLSRGLASSGEPRRRIACAPLARNETNTNVSRQTRNYVSTAWHESALPHYDVHLERNLVFASQPQEKTIDRETNLDTSVNGLKARDLFKGRSSAF